MKRITIFSLLVIYACSDKKSAEDPFPPEQIVICGRIIGADFHQLDIEVGTNDDFNRPHRFYVKPDSTDYFEIRFSRRWPGDIRIKVGKNRFEAKYFPGDSVYISGHVNIDNDGFVRTMEFSGQSANRFRYFQRKEISLYNHYIEDLIGRGFEASYKEFKLLRDSIHNLQLTQLSEDTTGLMLDQEFINFELNELKYSHLNKMVREPMLRLHLRHDSTKIPDDYFGFLATHNWSDNTFINSHTFYSFLKSSFSALSKDTIPNYLGLSRTRAFQNTYKKFSDSLLSGQVKQYFRSITLDELEETDLNYFDSLKESLRAEGFKNFFLDHYDLLSDSLRAMTLTLNSETQINTPEGEKRMLLEEIANKEYTYLNVWFVGCSGCAADFSKQRYFVRKYEDDIQFINVCVSRPGSHFDNFISKYPDVGKHFFDSNRNVENQVKLYPYHGLFNSKGELVKNNVYRPSDERLDAYLSQITATTN